MNYNYILSFANKDNAALATIKKRSNSNLLASISFAYSYNDRTTQFALTNIVSTNASVTIKMHYPITI